MRVCLCVFHTFSLVPTGSPRQALVGSAVPLPPDWLTKNDKASLVRWLGRRRTEIFNTALVGHGSAVKKRKGERHTQRTHREGEKKNTPLKTSRSERDEHGELAHTVTWLVPICKE